MARIVGGVRYPAAVIVLAAALAAPAFGQSLDPRTWFNWGSKETTGSVPAAKPAPASQPAPPLTPVAQTPQLPGAPPPWSGESGSSGHPLMTADAIRAAAANFGACLEGIW